MLCCLKTFSSLHLPPAEKRRESLRKEKMGERPPILSRVNALLPRLVRRSEGRNAEWDRRREGAPLWQMGTYLLSPFPISSPLIRCSPHRDVCGERRRLRSTISLLLLLFLLFRSSTFPPSSPSSSSHLALVSSSSPSVVVLSSNSALIASLPPHPPSPHSSHHFFFSLLRLTTRHFPSLPGQ